MKVLNLRCRHEHPFEGWFASEDDFLAQQARGAVACPLCEDTEITRLPSAPRLNVAHLRDVPAAPAPSGAQLQARLLHAVRQVLARTEDVGERFAEEARRIHYGEVHQRSIRGQASAEDADALRDEGIEVMALPVPAALKEPLQ
jgi:hypothetical protein